MADDDLTYGEKRILSGIADIKGQLNGIAAAQSGAAHAVNRLIVQVANLETSLNTLGQEVRAKLEALSAPSQNETAPKSSQDLLPPSAE